MGGPSIGTTAARPREDTWQPRKTGYGNDKLSSSTGQPSRKADGETHLPVNVFLFLQMPHMRDASTKGARKENKNKM